MARFSSIALCCVLLAGCGARTILEESAFAEPADGAVPGTPGSDGAVGSETGTTTPVDPGASTDAGTSTPGNPGTPTAPIGCGRGACDPTTHECCIRISPNDGHESACTPKGTCSDGIALSCSSPTGCTSGQLCCLDFSDEKDTPRAICRSSCEGRERLRLCNADSDCRDRERCRPTRIGVMACIRAN